jgi:hypothetical protein
MTQMLQGQTAMPPAEPPLPGGVPGFRLCVPNDGSPPRFDVVREGSTCRLLRRGPLSFVACGDPLGDAGPVRAEVLLKRYLSGGAEALCNLDGAFVLAAVHADTGAACVVTDPLHSRKAFVEQGPRSVEVVSSLGFLPPRARALDPVAVVSYLANGTLYGGRTIFTGTRVLPRASVLRLSARGLDARSYESWRFDGAFEGRPAPELREELRGLLLRAVARRAPANGAVHLSLSGGDRAAALLGCLRELGRTDVRCFSYVHGGGPGADADAVVAGRRAGVVGFPHMRFDAFAGELERFIERNVALGLGRANPCFEIDAWDRLREEAPGAVILAGDDALGWKQDRRLRTAAEVRAAIPIRDSRVLRSFGPAFAPLEEAGSAFDAELEEMVREAAHADACDTRDFLDLEQRVGHLLLTWRELFPGGVVRCPLLDRELLKFLSHVPSTYRSGKRLFKEVVYEMFPELYGLESANAAPVSDPWVPILGRARPALESELASTPSPLDAWLPPEGCRALLHAAVSTPTAPRAGADLPAALVFLRVMLLRRFSRSLDT